MKLSKYVIIYYWCACCHSPKKHNHNAANMYYVDRRKLMLHLTSHHCRSCLNMLRTVSQLLYSWFFHIYIFVYSRQGFCKHCDYLETGGNYKLVRIDAWSYFNGYTKFSSIFFFFKYSYPSLMRQPVLKKYSYPSLKRQPVLKKLSYPSLKRHLLNNFFNKFLLSRRLSDV